MLAIDLSTENVSLVNDDVVLALLPKMLDVSVRDDVIELTHLQGRFWISATYSKLGFDKADAAPQLRNFSCSLQQQPPVS